VSKGYQALKGAATLQAAGFFLQTGRNPYASRKKPAAKKAAKK